MVLGVATLAFTGLVILMAHPRLYWGHVGNDMTSALIELPISKNYHHRGWETSRPFFDGVAGSPISGIRTLPIFNYNSWGRSLHFLMAWILVITGGVYVGAGIITGHLPRNLLPRAIKRAPRRLWQDLRDHFPVRTKPARGGPPYGPLQKLAYCVVILLALPLMVLTGLAMSPAITVAYPWVSDLFGGSQSARTIHFGLFVALGLFTFGHMLMVVLSGLKTQMRAMTVGE